MYSLLTLTLVLTPFLPYLLYSQNISTTPHPYIEIATTISDNSQWWNAGMSNADTLSLLILVSVLFPSLHLILEKNVGTSLYWFCAHAHSLSVTTLTSVCRRRAQTT